MGAISAKLDEWRRALANSPTAAYALTHIELIETLIESGRHQYAAQTSGYIQLNAQLLTTCRHIDALACMLIKHYACNPAVALDDVGDRAVCHPPGVRGRGDPARVGVGGDPEHWPCGGGAGQEPPGRLARGGDALGVAILPAVCDDRLDPPHDRRFRDWVPFGGDKVHEHIDMICGDYAELFGEVGVPPLGCRGGDAPERPAPPPRVELARYLREVGGVDAFPPHGDPVSINPQDLGLGHHFPPGNVGRK